MPTANLGQNMRLTSSNNPICGTALHDRDQRDEKHSYRHLSDNTGQLCGLTNSIERERMALKRFRTPKRDERDMNEKENCKHDATSGQGTREVRMRVWFSKSFVLVSGNSGAKRDAVVVGHRIRRIPILSESASARGRESRYRNEASGCVQTVYHYINGRK